MYTLPTSAREHQQEADDNQALAESLVDSHPTGGLIIAFYSALHLVSEYAAFEGGRHRSHRARAEWLDRCMALAPIAPTYEKLQANAAIARYDCPPSHHHTRSTTWVRSKALGWLRDIRDCVESAEAANSYQL